MNAIKHWTFKPYIRDGEATRVTVKIPVDFAFAKNVIRDVTPDSTTTNLQAQAEGITTIYAVHRMNGERVALVRDRALAFALARHHDMAPVSVH